MSQAQKGMALIEALIASAILGIGLLGATQLTLRTFQTAIETRERHVAQILAEEAVDCVQSGRLCANQETVEMQGIQYTREIQLAQLSPGLMDVRVTVSWPSSFKPTPASQGGVVQLDWHTRALQLPNGVER